MEFKSKQAFIAANQPQWKQTGLILKAMRFALEVSQKTIGDKIGVSVSVIAKLERGKPIKRRRLVETSYRTALEAIKLEKQKSLDNLNVQRLFCLKRRRNCI